MLCARRLAYLSLMALLLVSACAGGSDSPPRGGGGQDPADLGPQPEPDAGPCTPGSCAAGDYCGEDGRCRAGCTSDQECPDGQLCNHGTHGCEARDCFDDTHCAAEAPRCYVLEGRCGCGRTEDCEAGSDCNLDGWCVPAGSECEEDRHCSAERVCTDDGWCVPEGLECRGDLHCGDDLRCTEQGFCLPEGVQCAQPEHCAADRTCNPQGFCVPEGIDCEQAEQCADGQTCSERGFCVPEGEECEIAAHCPPEHRCDDASGSCVPTDAACETQGCPNGQACNRFGLCSPVGVECTEEAHCPGAQRCGPTSTCVPADAECDDPADCGPPQRTCNEYGVCVSSSSDLRLCLACDADGECGARDGVCLNNNYTDRRGRVINANACLPECTDDVNCPRGMDCESYRRDGRPAKVCKPRVATCLEWLRWEDDCMIDEACGPQGQCRDLHTDLSVDLQCTWACGTDPDCPAGARCGEFGYCRYE